MDRPQLTVRPATIDDADAVCELLDRLGSARPREEVPDAVGKISSELHRELLLAVAGDGEIAGMVAVSMLEPLDELHSGGRVETIVSGRERSGAGRVLLSAAEQWVRDRGGQWLEMTTPHSFAGAKRFYEAMGYRNRGIRFARRIDNPATPQSRGARMRRRLKGLSSRSRSI